MTPVSALGFDPNRRLLILGDIFGNVEIWSIEKLCAKAIANKKFLADRFSKRKAIAEKDKGYETAVGLVDLDIYRSKRYNLHNLQNQPY